MTPKEKAEEFVNKFYGYILYENESVYSEKMLRIFKIKAKNCALIAVDEILAVFYDDIREMWLDELNYWHQVKKEIEAL
jgi:hypothetical protein